MWMHWGALYSPWLSFWNPISWYMLSPWAAALASTNGLGRGRTDDHAGPLDTSPRQRRLPTGDTARTRNSSPGQRPAPPLFPS